MADFKDANRRVDAGGIFHQAAAERPSQVALIFGKRVAYFEHLMACIDADTREPFERLRDQQMISDL